MKVVQAQRCRIEVTNKMQTTGARSRLVCNRSNRAITYCYYVHHTHTPLNEIETLQTRQKRHQNGKMKRIFQLFYLWLNLEFDLHRMCALSFDCVQTIFEFTNNNILSRYFSQASTMSTFADTKSLCRPRTRHGMKFKQLIYPNVKFPLPLRTHTE